MRLEPHVIQQSTYPGSEQTWNASPGSMAVRDFVVLGLPVTATKKSNKSHMWCSLGFGILISRTLLRRTSASSTSAHGNFGLEGLTFAHQLATQRAPGRTRVPFATQVPTCRVGKYRAILIANATRAACPSARLTNFRPSPPRLAFVLVWASGISSSSSG